MTFIYYLFILFIYVVSENLYIERLLCLLLILFVVCVCFFVLICYMFGMNKINMNLKSYHMILISRFSLSDEMEI